jgi:hypothetical protein
MTPSATPPPQGSERWIGAPRSKRRSLVALLAVVLAFAIAIVLVYGLDVRF